MILRAQGLALAGRLEPTDLQLEGGTLTALIGPNGSGKTSLLHALAGVGRPEGNVEIAGTPLAQVPASARPRLIGYVPAWRDLRWPLAARDLIRLGGASEAEIERVLEHLDLRALADRPTDRLSTGERSRVLLARALAPSPKLLLLDEPAANLDPLWQIRLMDVLREEARNSARGLLVAMHDLDTAERHADRVIVMQHRRITADDDTATVFGSGVIAQVFGVKRHEGRWTAA